MKLLREYIRALLTEDPVGFVRDLAAATQAGEFGEEEFYGGEIGITAGRVIKRAFNANADHQWLSTLNTVHWTGDAYELGNLVGKNKDELSTSMSLPGETFEPAFGMADMGTQGLWVKGRITLAVNDHDALYSHGISSYVGPAAMFSPEEQEQRERSSGVNKLPSVSKDYSRYDRIKPGTEFGEKMARNIPYVLDQSTWDPEQLRSETNEALVDNWRAVGIVVTGGFLKFVRHYARIGPADAIGVMKELFGAAEEFGVPIFDVNQNELWSP